MTSRILYLLHTDWAWIKQRSQFIAEELDRAGLDVRVVYKWSPRRADLVRDDTPLRVRPAPFLPFRWRTGAVPRWLDTALWRLLLSLYLRITGITHVVVTHPLLGDYVAGERVRIIYDCHDDNAEFYPDGPLKRLIEDRHRRLLARSDLQVFSSAHLRGKYATDPAAIVVRNGHQVGPGRFAPRPIDHPPTGHRAADGFEIVYFGTISEWFDVDLVRYLLDRSDRIRFTLVGPLDAPAIDHPRVAYTGPMNHADLLAFAARADCFVMPFRVNPLIEGVDPVKLYEYLSYDVPVLSVFYEELSHFAGLVDFYRDPAEAWSRVERYLQGDAGPVDRAGRDAFLATSTWRARADRYAAAIAAMPAGSGGAGGNGDGGTV